MKTRMRVSRYFFDDKRILKSIDAATARALSKAGAWVRTSARSSIRQPRQQPLADMTAEERKAHRIRLAIARRKGLPRPKRRLMPSRPGEPPRNVTGTLKGSILFAYDASTKSVWIGPVFLGSKTAGRATRALEHGSAKIEQRPFMAPALKSVTPKLAPQWAHSLR